MLASEVINRFKRKDFPVSERRNLAKEGEKWGFANKEKLYKVGVATRQVKRQGIILIFASTTEVLGCVKHILSAIGISFYAAVAVLKKAIGKYLNQKKSFSLRELIVSLKMLNDQDEIEWARKIQDRFEGYGELPNINFQVDKGESFANESTI